MVERSAALVDRSRVSLAIYTALVAEALVSEPAKLRGSISPKRGLIGTEIRQTFWVIFWFLIVFYVF